MAKRIWANICVWTRTQTVIMHNRCRSAEGNRPCKSSKLGVSSLTSTIGGTLFGQGLLSLNGIIWAHQRKINAPELVKGMMDVMVESATLKLRSWETEIESKGGLRVDQNLRNLSSDIIARACFQSSYHEGKEIFVKFRALKKVVNKGMMGIPGFRYGIS
ncbi:hypothetical protein EV1_039974 [Malus domestica]